MKRARPSKKSEPEPSSSALGGLYVVSIVVKAEDACCHVWGAATHVSLRRENVFCRIFLHFPNTFTAAFEALMDEDQGLNEE
ncbi:hypothetical protein ACROYT_G007772 [Oculina patagonica]